MNDKLLGIRISGRYEILNKIASGGMSDVYLGKDLKLDRKVAVKILHESYSSNRNFTARFEKEARILANLKSPNIVTVYDWGEFDGLYFIIMEFLNGKSLKEIIEKEGAIEPLLAAEYSVQICKALALAHEGNLIHRDIKPQNIMITEEGVIKVTDFGIAKFTAGDITKTINILGTAHYISPEQAQGKILDNRSDIYSLGIVMYEMLTSDIPFRGGSSIDISLRHINEEPQPPSAIRPAIPKKIEKIVMRCLEKNPDYRYQNVESLELDLQNFLEGKPLIVKKEQKNGREKLWFFGPKVDYRYESQFERSFEKYKLKNKRIMFGLISLCSVAVTAFIVFLTLFLITGLKADSLANNLNLVVVPQMHDMDYKAAKNLLLNYGLIIEARDSIYSDSVPENHIIEQSIEPGTELKKNTILYVTLSRGKETLMVSVPNLIGISRSSAITQLESCGLSVGKISEEYNDTIKKDAVIVQSIPAGLMVEKKTGVDLIISKGRELITVPDVKGYDYIYAKTYLESLGLSVDAKRKTDTAIKPGIVIGIEPMEGSAVLKNSSVVIFVSTGEQLISVPDLLNLNFEIAQQILASFDIGFEIHYLDVDNLEQRNSVIEQYPAAGEQIALKDKIILFVGQ